jgi:hypothetical protein
MLKFGIVITAATITILIAEYFRKRRRNLPLYGWLGLLALVCAEFLMFRGVEPVATFFTPLAWTAYILVADAAALAISGRSELRESPRGLLKMAILSIPLWAIFEAYNLRLANWTYLHLPESRMQTWLGFAWAFATITPGIFVTASLVESLGWFNHRSRPLTFGRAGESAAMIAGAMFLVFPLLVPARAGQYLFAPVWLGFFLLLDPINCRLHRPSMEGDLARGARGRLYSFLIAGWICGWLWEFWNYWARTRWVYTFPIMQDWKIFQMPAPGYLAFPVFALECFAMYVTGAWMFSRKQVAEKKYQK